MLLDDGCHEAIAVTWHRGHAVAGIDQRAPQQEDLLREVALLDDRSGPDERENLVLRERASVMLDQRDEQIEGFGRQRDRGAVALEPTLIGTSRKGPNGR